MTSTDAATTNAKQALKSVQWHLDDLIDCVDSERSSLVRRIRTIATQLDATIEEIDRILDARTETNAQ